MHLVSIGLVSVLLVGLSACGSQRPAEKTEPVRDQATAESKTDVNAPQYLLVKVDESGVVATKSADQALDMGDGAQVAATFDVGQGITALTGDGQDNSKESYNWNNGGRNNCYNNYSGCRPTYRSNQNRVNYSYYGRVQNRGCNYYGYRRSQLNYWQGSGYDNYYYSGYDNNNYNGY